ncbi:MAG: winged helix-turn-helix domain-containing protein [Syntrophales bacterium]|jgi:phosphate regulon transcriptional regulator PhoB|nr:winged helix-turn-helix domain-containing protein [Syntrophales bacterium]
MAEGKGVQKTLLVADDEKDIVDLVTYNLAREGFHVLAASDGLESMKIIRDHRPDMVILDWMMPGMDGLEVCRRLRQDPETSRIPVIMLTAKSDTVDKILGLEMGADDYVTKPFHVRELVARIHAVLRRHDAGPPEEASQILTCRGIRMDLRSYRITVDNRPIDLTPREIKLLAFLMRHPGRVYSRDQLLDYVWGDETFVEPRTVDVHISRLRSLIDKDKEHPPYIHTVRGIGYKFGNSE